MLSLSRVKEVFAQHHVEDAQGRARMPRCNVGEALWDLDINPVFANLDEAVTRHDSDGDGLIDLEEFKAFYLSMYREYATNPQRALSTYLLINDPKNTGVYSGFVTRDEMRLALTDGFTADKLTDEEFDSFFDSVDQDKDGSVCAAEFVVSMVPSIMADELNAMLRAYGLEENAHLYCKAKPEEKASSPRRRRIKKHADPNAEAAARIAAAERAEQLRAEERRRREEAEWDEKRKNETEAARKEREAAEKKKREEEERKRKEKEDAEKNKPKEGGCCTVM